MTDLFKQYDDFDFGDKQIKTVKENANFCTTCAGSNLTYDNVNGIIVCTDCGQVQDKQVLVPDQMQTGDDMPVRINLILPQYQLKLKKQESCVSYNNVIDTMLKSECDSIDEYDDIDEYDSIDEYASDYDCDCSRCSRCYEKDTNFIKLEKKVQELTNELKKAHDVIAKIKADLMKIVNN